MIDISKGRYWDEGIVLVDGCTPCSPGCDHCWSAARAHMFCREGEPGHSSGILTDIKGRFNGDILVHPERLSAPLKRRKPTVYAIWNDLFHEAVQYGFIDQAISVASLSPQHTFLILTKRPSMMADFYRIYQQKYGVPPSSPFPNVYHGLTVCNQQEADEKIPIFLQVPGKKFLSIEPMLSGIDLRPYLPNPITMYPGVINCSLSIDAVILGGETGHGARPLHPDWVRSVRDQCMAAGVPFFFKGWGEWLPVEPLADDIDGFGVIAFDHREYLLHDWDDYRYSLKFGRKSAGRLLDGRTHDELPWREV